MHNLGSQLAIKVVVLLSLSSLLAHTVFADDSTGYDYGDYIYDDDIDNNENDDYGYYSDDTQQFYDYHGYYPGEYDGYDFDGDYSLYDECVLDRNAQPVLSNDTTACPIKIEGVDKQAPNLSGGIDGKYELASCYNGKPLYRRSNTTSPGGQSRVLWFSETFGDWDISNGSEPNEAEIMMYGGEKEFASIPILVNSWRLGAGLKNSSAKTDNYVEIKVQMTCADGTKVKVKEMRKKQQTQQTGPMLTNDEWDKKYNEIYERYGKRPEPNPTVNFTFVVMLVMIGLTIVLAIPYFLMKKKDNPKASISSSFTQLLQQSKKKQSGHAL